LYCAGKAFIIREKGLFGMDDLELLEIILEELRRIEKSLLKIDEWLGRIERSYYSSEKELVKIAKDLSEIKGILAGEREYLTVAASIKIRIDLPENIRIQVLLPL
jgi:hypothetical protein